MAGVHKVEQRIQIMATGYLCKRNLHTRVVKLYYYKGFPVEEANSQLLVFGAGFLDTAAADDVSAPPLTNAASWTPFKAMAGQLNSRETKLEKGTKFSQFYPQPGFMLYSNQSCHGNKN